MKLKITKEEFNALPDILKAEYEEKGNAYFQKVPDQEDAILAIKQAKDNESAAHKETKAALAKAAADLEELRTGQHRKNGDVEALDASWKAKFAERETELLNETNTLKGAAIKAAKQSVLTGIAAKHVKPEYHRMFMKDIDERFDVQLENGQAVVKVLSADGKPSALTMQDFEKEILANKEYAPIIIASRASGGSAPRVLTGAGGTTPNETQTPLRLQKNADIVALLKSKKEGE